MAFWSGETLRSNLGEIVDPFDPDRVDGAAYTMSIGPEVYISPSASDVNKELTTKRYLAEEEAFTIPSGQFAFLLTDERVKVPANSLCLISIRAKPKFKGLVNVSGFHVDPGYSGRLIFSVFNAGPAPIHLERGDKIFLIWFADLDASATLGDAKGSDGPQSIPTNLVQGISGSVHSLSTLSDRIDKLEADVKTVTAKISIYATVGAIILTFLIRLAFSIFGDSSP